MMRERRAAQSTYGAAAGSGGGGFFGSFTELFTQQLDSCIDCTGKHRLCLTLLYNWALNFLGQVSVGTAICTKSDTVVNRKSMFERQSFRIQRLNQHTFLCMASLGQKGLVAHV